jgi:hypothetical protein
MTPFEVTALSVTLNAAGIVPSANNRVPPPHVIGNIIVPRRFAFFSSAGNSPSEGVCFRTPRPTRFDSETMNYAAAAVCSKSRVIVLLWGQCGASAISPRRMWVSSHESIMRHGSLVRQLWERRVQCRLITADTRSTTSRATKQAIQGGQNDFVR